MIKMTVNYQIFLGFLIIAICAIGGVYGSLLVKKGFEEKSKSYSQEQQNIQQNSTGINSPNINAPNAKTILINYGISEKFSKEWTKQLKGNEEAISVLIDILKDLKEQKATIGVVQGLVQDVINMRAELERRLAEKPAEVSKKTEPLIKFNHQEFIDKFIVFFQSYNHYRKSLNLMNPEMLIELLNVYFRSVLLYPSNEMKKYYITASDGRLLLFQINGQNEKGEKTLISLPELSSSLLKDVCTNFIKTANPKQYEMLEDLFNRALATPDLDKSHKSNILDAQNFIQNK